MQNLEIKSSGDNIMPYHTQGVAHGLAFSSNIDTYFPPSLRMIFKELGEKDYKKVSPNLQRWADQGVLLLNPVLTVRKGAANSHSHIGWQEFTKQIIKLLIEEKPEDEKIVFLIWGKEAEKFLKDCIKSVKRDKKDNLISIVCPHPAAEIYKPGCGFLGSDCFTKCNEELEKIGKTKINWL